MSADLLPATTPLFNCPQCRAPVRAGDITCQACGVNLALAVVLTERQMLVTMPATRPPCTGDVPRFGEFLVKYGYAIATQGEGFRPFHQLPDPSSHLVDGTGLALAWVKCIVEAHESSVEVQSQPGHESTFAFELSVATPP